MHTFKENKVGREQISWNKIHHGHKQKSFVAKGIKIEKNVAKEHLNDLFQGNKLFETKHISNINKKHLFQRNKI